MTPQFEFRGVSDFAALKYVSDAPEVVKLLVRSLSGLAGELHDDPRQQGTHDKGNGRPGKLFESTERHGGATERSVGTGQRFAGGSRHHVIPLVNYMAKSFVNGFVGPQGGHNFAKSLSVPGQMLLEKTERPFGDCSSSRGK